MIRRLLTARSDFIVPTLAPSDIRSPVRHSFPFYYILLPRLQLRASCWFKSQVTKAKSLLDGKLAAQDIPSAKDPGYLRHKPRLAASDISAHPDPPYTMNRMPPPDGHHGHPGPHTAYEPAWRPPYPPTFDNHPSDSRRSSANSQTPLPPQPPGYPVMPNRELPQLISEGPYGRPNGHGLPLHAPVHSPQDPMPPHPNFHQPMNGAPHEGSPDYRARMGYPPPDQINSAEHTPVSGALPPASQFMTPGPQMASATPPAGYDQAFYQNQTFGARQRKANRATQVC